MASSPEDQRWITGSARRSSVYHTDRECHHLERDDRDPEPAKDSEIAYHELGLCPDCGDGEYRTGSTDTVLACPECKWATLGRAGRRSEHDYRCRQCSATVDEADAVERERKGDARKLPSGSLAAALDDLDADAIGGTEGDRDE